MYVENLLSLGGRKICDSEPRAMVTWAGDAEVPLVPAVRSGICLGDWVCRPWKEGRKRAQEDPEPLAWPSHLSHQVEGTPTSHAPSSPPLSQCCCPPILNGHCWDPSLCSFSFPRTPMDPCSEDYKDSVIGSQTLRTQRASNCTYPLARDVLGYIGTARDRVLQCPLTNTL